MAQQMTLARLNASTGIPLAYANRHGLISGATGTGKTVTLMRLAEQFSRSGVPVFVSDVKGDIAALQRSCPVDRLDLYGVQGRPVSVSLWAMGADLVSRALELSDAQSGVVEAAFDLAARGRRRHAPLDTIDDMRKMLAFMSARKQELAAGYGQITAPSIGVVVRALNRLERQAGDGFFRPGAPYDVADLLAGQSKVSILAADYLVRAPRLYGAFLLWLLSDLYERLPEVGDLPAPRLVLFFDEAHLLFDDSPPALLRKIEQTVRLIRSKGVGVYFASQSADDVPQAIRDQLAHRIEHDRALPVGTARVRTMSQAGRPLPVVTVRIDRPSCPLGALAGDERQPSMLAPVARRVRRTPAYEAGKHAAFALAAGMFCFGAAVIVQTVRNGSPDMWVVVLAAACAIGFALIKGEA